LTWILHNGQWLLNGLRTYAIPFVIVLGVVVLFHEFGHFLMAKLFGITVEIFSVGFGPRITGFRRGGTDYRVSWVPLGGYVKLKGEVPSESGAPPDPGDLLSRPRWQRFLVFVMGAVFNLITAFVVMAALFMTGIEVPAYQDRPPVVGEIEPGSPAEKAGILVGDRILSYGGQQVAAWKDLEPLVSLSPGQTREVVLERDGRRVATSLTPDASRNDIGVPGFLPETGVVVKFVMGGSPAEKAGFKAGDRILSIDGVPMTTVTGLLKKVWGSAGKPLQFVLLRGETNVTATAVPVESEGRGLLGFRPDYPMVVRAYPFVEALAESLKDNLEKAGQLFVIFRKLFRMEISLRAFSGPVDLYRYSGEVAALGLVPFLQLIAFISLQLGILNLLPIPPLDGGHVFTILIEGTIRRDLSSQIKERAMQVGLVLLLVFMATVIYFDIRKNFFH
jgi:regulator of sigma E protease